MNRLDGIDPELRAPLEELRETFPGGLYAIADLAERRRIDAVLAAELNEVVEATRTCSTEDVRVPGADVPVLVVSTGYRKAPEHPHPAQVDDCYAALGWMSGHATSLDFDAGRLAVFGGSAGGNLALATALKARDLGGPALAYVVALYPMVDHRNAARAAHQVGPWDRRANAEAWAWFLAGREPDGYAAPLHAQDLAGLPSTFIDVGTADLFRDENLALAQRLLAAGVTTELHVHPGVYHAAEYYAPDAEVARHMWTVRFRALRRALGIEGSSHDA